MTESSFSGNNDLTAGATVEGDGETADSATADREAAFDDPTSSAAGNITADDAAVATPLEDSTATENTAENTAGAGGGTSHAADVDAGYDESSESTSG